MCSLSGFLSLSESSANLDKLLKENPNWKVLDIGCGYTANDNASIICDVQDLSNFYKDRNFVRLIDKTLPFKDKESFTTRITISGTCVVEELSK